MKELDIVRLVQEFQGIPVGTEGTIVHKHETLCMRLNFSAKTEVLLM